jgi:hypothetical protein
VGLEKKMKSMRCSEVVIELLLAVVLGTLPCAAQEYHLHPSAEPIPPTLFGLVIHKAVALKATPWPDVPFSGWRLWDSYVTWWDLEPGRKGNWQFGNLDRMVSLAEGHRVQCLMNLGMTPTWASARPSESPKFRPGSIAEPKNIQDWRDFVSAVGTRYKGRILDWEVWNEPNDPAFYTGSIGQLVDVSKVAYQTLKQIDSSNIVVSPSPTYGLKGTDWLNSYLRAGGGAFADVIGYHLYTVPEGPEAMVPLAQKIKSVMVENGVGDKPLWNTEAGWYIQNKAGTVAKSGAFTPLPALSAAGIVARSYVLTWASGVSRFYWYDWDGAVMSLSDEDGKSLKPAGYAYEVIRRWLIGARMTACDSDSSDTWICEITRDGGYSAYIVWNPRGDRDFKIPPAWKVHMEREIDDHHGDLKASSVKIGLRPILLETKAAPWEPWEPGGHH